MPDLQILMLPGCGSAGGASNAPPESDVPAYCSQTQPLGSNSWHAILNDKYRAPQDTYLHICAYVQVPVRHTPRRKYRYDLFEFRTLSTCLPSTSFLFVFSKVQRLRTLGTSGQGPYLAVQTLMAMHDRRVRTPHGRIILSFCAEPTPKRQFVLKYFMHASSQATS